MKVTGKSPAALCRSCYAKMYNCYAYNTESTFSYNPLLIRNDGAAWNVLYYSSSENRDAADKVPLTAASLDGTYAAARLNDGIETASTLVVRATSAYDESVSGTIEVTLIDITDAAEGSRFNPYLIESEADFMALTA